jgi:hypothetical protein
MPHFATVKEACDWADTHGESGCDLRRLLNMGLEPLIWLEPSPDGGRDAQFAHITIDERDIYPSYVLYGECRLSDGVTTLHIFPKVPAQIADLRFLWPLVMAAVVERRGRNVPPIQPDLDQHALEPTSTSGEGATDASGATFLPQPLSSRSGVALIRPTRKRCSRNYAHWQRRRIRHSFRGAA